MLLLYQDFYLQYKFYKLYLIMGSSYIEINDCICVALHTVCLLTVHIHRLCVVPYFPMDGACTVRSILEWVYTQQHNLIVTFKHFLSVRKVSQYWLDSIYLKSCDWILRTFPCHDIPSGSRRLCYWLFFRGEKPCKHSHIQSTSKYFHTHNRVHDGLTVSGFVHLSGFDAYHLRNTLKTTK